MDPEIRRYLDDLGARVLEAVDGKVGATDARVAILDGKVDALDARVTVLDGKVDALDARVTVLDGKVDALDARVTVLDGKVDALDAKIDALDAKVDGQGRTLLQAMTAMEDRLTASIQGRREDIDTAFRDIVSPRRRMGRLERRVKILERPKDS